MQQRKNYTKKCSEEFLNCRDHAAVDRTILVFILIYFYFLSYCYSHLFTFWYLKKFAVLHRGQFSRHFFQHPDLSNTVCDSSFMKLFMFFLALRAVLHITNNWLTVAVLSVTPRVLLWWCWFGYSTHRQCQSKTPLVLARFWADSRLEGSAVD